MDINRWKSCAVDIESYTIIRAMGKQGFRRPGSMIAKLVRRRSKENSQKRRQTLRGHETEFTSEGKKLLNGK
jgi:hypothetical protein